MSTLPNRPPVPEADAQVGRRARVFRERANLSQYRLGLLMGCPATDVSAFEVGKIRRGPKFVAKYAAVVGVPVEAIVPPPTRLDEMLAMRRKGATLSQIGLTFGVSRQAVWAALRRAP